MRRPKSPRKHGSGVQSCSYRLPQSAETYIKTTPKKSDLPVLTEFGNLTHYGFIHRDLMRFTEDGVTNLVKLGKDSVDAAVTVDESFVPLQNRLESLLAQLDKVEGEHT